MDIKVEETENVKSLSEVTADTIVQHIINEGLGKGDKLPNEKILCELLGVGRSTLREAVRMLASRNILIVKHGSGIYVSDKPGVSQDPLGFTFVKDKKRLIHDLVEFRMMLEPRVAALAAQNRTKEQLAKLEAQAAVVDELISQGKSHAQADSVFHSLLGEMSGNSVLPNLEPIIFKAIDLFIDLSQSKLSHDTIGEHRAIVEAIKAGKSVDASDAMIAHLLNNKNYIMKVLEHEKF
ncbi:FadR/GntR family transcriptional regulator [uncultured Succinatimonas sp.]|uniref:FadR/GntR family transcriptional regulator n=1 Tax=uncultured Succinatimonas sp. TaxID=1262973 RepID=UPI0025FC86FB|nr:FadR/GntR family transcriptional regulator [uncultured Succinatimonas sp.]